MIKWPHGSSVGIGLSKSQLRSLCSLVTRKKIEQLRVLIGKRYQLIEIPRFLARIREESKNRRRLSDKFFLKESVSI